MSPLTPEIVQQELSILGLLKCPEDIREDVLRTFGDSEDAAVTFAIRWAWDHRRCRPMSQAVAAQHIGISASHFCNILSGTKYLPPHKINAFEWVVGNKAVSRTIERFAQLREREQALQIAQLIVQGRAA